MKIFVIHRFADRSRIESLFKRLDIDSFLDIDPVFLDSCEDEDWKSRAKNEIGSSDIIVIYNFKECMDSDNAKWEINYADKLKKVVFEVNPNGGLILRKKNKQSKRLPSFFLGSGEVLPLYQIMVDTSERLIERRHKTNTFFVTVIGSLLAANGLLLKIDNGFMYQEYIIIALSFCAVIACNSWSNLIDNYGKLNSAKYKVILELEKKLSAEIFSAEWFALGEGKDPTKYKSFTKTEKNVPRVFAIVFSLVIYCLAYFLIAPYI